MSVRKVTVVLALAAAAAWSCSRTPSSPTAPGSIAGLNAPEKGKPDPPPPPPPPQQYSMTLGPSIHDDPSSVYPGSPSSYPDASRDGLPSPGHFGLSSAVLTGLISGPTSSGHFTGSLTGTVSGLRITNVAELPDWFDGGDPCQEGEVAQLAGLGLVGNASSLAGSLTMTWSEFKVNGGLDSRGTYAQIEWELGGVSDNSGGAWSLAGHTGRARPQTFGPVFEPGSTADNLTVTVENSVIDFLGSSFSVLKCRADYTLTLTKIVQP